jgi:MFS family permease
MAAAPSIAVLAVGWSLTSIAANALMAGLLAVLPDQVPPRRRGTVSAMVGVGQALASVLGAGLVRGLSGHVVPMFVVPALLTILLCVPLLIGLPDRRLLPSERRSFDGAAFLRSFWVNPRRYPDFGWAWLSRFMIFMSIASVLNYQVFYLADRFGLHGDAVQNAVLAGVTVQTVMVLLSSNLVGALSDRLGHRQVFVCVSASIAAAGLLGLALAHTRPVYLLAMALVGLGQGTYFAVDLALVADVLPNRGQDAGKDLGVMNIANTLPQSLAPAVAPLFIGLGSYTGLFLAGCGYAAISALSVLRVRGEQAQQEVERGLGRRSVV